jgi:hypothetical protein
MIIKTYKKPDVSQRLVLGALALLFEPCVVISSTEHEAPRAAA